VQIAILGPLEVRTDAGQPRELAGARLRTLLILLALEPGRIVANGRLIDGIWGEDPPAGAANALQALVSRLRRALPEAPLDSHPTGYRLALAADHVDIFQFERLAAAGREALGDQPAKASTLLHEALELWRGPALEEVADAPFARARAAGLTELRAGATEDLIEAELALGNPASLVAAAEELVARYPYRERAIGLLMRVLCAAGRPADALAAFDRARTGLANDLGTDPSPVLSALHTAVLRGELSTAAPAPRPEFPEAVPTNLRAQLTSFVGRADDIASVGTLTRRHRLTTLVGPGGAGKTRLATEAARAQAPHHPDGVYLVELAPVTDPAELASVAIVSLGLRERAVMTRGLAAADVIDPVTRLVAAIADKRVLLVLDNCEHLVAAAAELADRLLGAAPGLTILATSREPLGITGETLWTVEPLPMPPADARAGEAIGYASVRLLADRAAAVRPGFVVDDATVGAVVRICRGLDGMPLAIELAAARLRAMTPEQVAARLDDRFRLLTGGSRTALARHQTLRAVVDWSWDLLSDAERTLWRRLSVFSGASTVEAAEAVAGGGVLAPAEVLDLIASLVDKSILVPGGTPQRPRYRMLETIREYGLQRLQESTEEPRTRLAHAEYFLSLAESAEPRLRTGEQMAWLRRLREEDEDLHAAVRYAIATRDAGLALRLLASLAWYWWLVGYRVEGTTLAAQALAMDLTGVPRETLAIAYGLSSLNSFGVQHDETGLEWIKKARALSDDTVRTEQSHPIMRMLGPLSLLIDSIQTGLHAEVAEALTVLFDDPDPFVVAAGRAFHAHAELNSGHEERAQAQFELALDSFRAIGERWGTSVTLGGLAEIASMRGEHALAAKYFDESLSYLTELGTSEDLPMALAQYGRELFRSGEQERGREMLARADRAAARVSLPECVAFVHLELATLNLVDGDTAQARRRLLHARAILPMNVVAPQFHALVASALALVDAADGDLESARALHAEALDLAAASGDLPVQRRVTGALADLALREGDPRRAAALLGATAGDRDLPDRSGMAVGRIEESIRATLDPAAFAEAFDRGRPLTPAEVAVLSGVPIRSSS
jgi:predicted ATPase/DNA-binding SARP family transcriptional activator